MDILVVAGWSWGRIMVRGEFLSILCWEWKLNDFLGFFLEQVLKLGSESVYSSRSPSRQTDQQQQIEQVQASQEFSIGKLNNLFGVNGGISQQNGLDLSLSAILEQELPNGNVDESFFKNATSTKPSQDGVGVVSFVEDSFFGTMPTPKKPQQNQVMDDGGIEQVEEMVVVDPLWEPNGVEYEGHEGQFDIGYGELFMKAMVANQDHGNEVIDNEFEELQKHQQEFLKREAEEEEEEGALEGSILNDGFQDPDDVSFFNEPNNQGPDPACDLSDVSIHDDQSIFGETVATASVSATIEPVMQTSALLPPRPKLLSPKTPPVKTAISKAAASHPLFSPLRMDNVPVPVIPSPGTFFAAKSGYMGNLEGSGSARVCCFYFILI